GAGGGVPGGAPEAPTRQLPHRVRGRSALGTDPQGEWEPGTNYPRPASGPAAPESGPTAPESGPHASVSGPHTSASGPHTSASGPTVSARGPGVPDPDPPTTRIPPRKPRLRATGPEDAPAPAREHGTGTAGDGKDDSGKGQAP
ncbi:hypothetical protein ACFV5E_25225, partial [Streptomyces chartreusis]